MEELALRVVFDTNVYITALAGRSGYILEYLRQARPDTGPRLFQLFVSQPILDELRAVATGKLGIEAATVNDFIEHTVRATATFVEPTMRIEGVVRQAADDRILECAVAAGAHIIITADKDLLSLKRFREVQIIHPSALKFMLPPSETA